MREKNSSNGRICYIPAGSVDGSFNNVAELGSYENMATVLKNLFGDVANVSEI